MRGGSAVELGFQPAGDGVVGRRCPAGERPDGGIARLRSLTTTFSHVSAELIDLIGIDAFQREISGLQSLVVTGDAVFGQVTDG